MASPPPTAPPPLPLPAGLPPPAWLQLDADSMLVHASPGALPLLDANREVLLLQHGRLRATRQPVRLEQALLLARLQGRAPLALQRLQRLPITLLCARWAPGDPAAGWCVTLRDPDAERPDRLLVQTLFGLTPSEAEVATALALGRSTAEIALSLGVQANTVLAHVKKVLTKTGTQRQAQLVSLLLRSVAVVATAAAAPGTQGLQPASDSTGQTLPPDCGVAANPVAEPCPSR